MNLDVLSRTNLCSVVFLLSRTSNTNPYPHVCMPPNLRAHSQPPPHSIWHSCKTTLHTSPRTEQNCCSRWYFCIRNTTNWTSCSPQRRGRCWQRTLRRCFQNLRKRMSPPLCHGTRRMSTCDILVYFDWMYFYTMTIINVKWFM